MGQKSIPSSYPGVLIIHVGVPRLRSAQELPVSTEIISRRVAAFWHPDCEQLETPLTWADLQWTCSLKVKRSAGEEGIEALDR